MYVCTYVFAYYVQLIIILSCGFIYALGFLVLKVIRIIIVIIIVIIIIIIIIAVVIFYFHDSLGLEGDLCYY